MDRRRALRSTTFIQSGMAIPTRRRRGTPGLAMFTVVKRVNADGTALHKKFFGGAGAEYLFAADGYGQDGFVGGGRLISAGGDSQAWLIWVDSKGELTGVKQRSFGSAQAQFVLTKHRLLI